MQGHAHRRLRTTEHGSNRGDVEVVDIAQRNTARLLRGQRPDERPKCVGVDRRRFVHKRWVIRQAIHRVSLPRPTPDTRPRSVDDHATNERSWRVVARHHLPLPVRRQERVLHHVFGRRPVATQGDRECEHPPVLRSVEVIEIPVPIQRPEHPIRRPLTHSPKRARAFTKPHALGISRREIPHQTPLALREGRYGPRRGRPVERAR